MLSQRSIRDRKMVVMNSRKLRVITHKVPPEDSWACASFTREKLKFPNRTINALGARKERSHRMPQEGSIGQAKGHMKNYQQRNGRVLVLDTP